MSDARIRGIFPILPATFTETGLFDCDSYRNALRALIGGGCHGVTLFGIAGELLQAFLRGGSTVP